jgi:aminopeptidase N
VGTASSSSTLRLVTVTSLDKAPLQDNLTETDARARAALLSNLSYEVSIVLSDDPDAETFQSATTVVFDAAHEGSETFINIAARSIEECTLNGKRLTDAQHAFDGTLLHLRGLRAGSNRLSVTAQCEYQHTGVGLHRLRDPVDGEVYVYTHFEPFDAHKVLACFDQPDLKATVTMTVTAPKAWRVCGNGSVVRSDVRGDAKVWHFKTTPPLPPYLIAVVAGKYHIVERKHRNIPMALWCRESLASWIDLQADEIFEITAAGLDFFEKYFGLTYPFDEYNQLFVPEFNMGAMENPGCVTFNEAYIHRGQASEAQLQRRAETILHEMAHVHGFGDVTTMRWWGDLWLNETFATYMANLALEKATRFTNAWVDFANSVKSIAARQDQLVTTHRIADHVPDTVSVRQNFDGITYHKGASVMRQLVAWVGDDAFKRGVQDYFKRYRWGNADLQEFLDCLRRASGRDLTRWGQDWLQTTGLNTFHVKLSDQNGRYTSFAIEQSAIPEHPTLRAHRAGVGLYDRDSKGVIRLRRRVETDLTGALTPINELVGERIADFVLLNDGDLTFAKLRFDERSLQTLKADLSRLADPLSRALCWAAMWDLTRDAEMPAREFAELVARHAPAEKDSLLVERVTSQARAAIDLYGDPPNREAARERLHQVAVEQVNNQDLSAELKLIWARILIGTAASEESLQKVAAMLDGGDAIPGMALDTDLRWLIVGQLAEEGHADVALIQATMASDPSDIGRRRGTACLAARPTAAAKEEAWLRIADPTKPMPKAWKGSTDGELSVASMGAILRGFYIGSVGVGGMMAHGPDPELLRPYVARYLDALPGVWAERTIDEAEMFTECLYPNHLVDDSVVAAVDFVLESGELPGPAVRILREGRDSTLRAQRARALDAEAGAASN